MRQAFMIGAVMLWIFINIIGSVVEMETPLARTESHLLNPDGTPMSQSEILQAMEEPVLTDSNFVTMFSKLGDYIKIAGAVLTLYHPALWQGTAQYVYFFLIMPIGISFWVVFVMAIRGVGSS